MQKLLPAFLLVLLLAASCKKNKSNTPAPTNNTTSTSGGQTSASTPVTISNVTPASGTPGTIVTLTGSNFGTVANDLKITLNGVAATIQSATDTEIKFIVPPTGSGAIVVYKGNQTVSGPAFTMNSTALIIPYVGGDVTLLSQADVDTFVGLNKGKQLQITGDLTIGDGSNYVATTNDITNIGSLPNITSVSGTIRLSSLKLTSAPFLDNLTSAGDIRIIYSNFSALSFGALKSFSGSFITQNLPALSRISMPVLQNVNILSITQSPLLTDLSFMGGIASANSITLSNLGVSTVALDNLTSLSGGLTISGNLNLQTVSCKNLTSINSSVNIVPTSILVTGCPAVSKIDFTSLSFASGKIAIRNTSIRDFAGFNALQTAGALEINSNPELVSLTGLERLSMLTSIAVQSGGFSSTPIYNGLYINANAKLATLSGLQNLTLIPLARITGNVLLNDLCAYKAPLIGLSKLPAYTYTYRLNGLDITKSGSQPALELTGNGQYPTTESALNAIALCR